MFSPQRKVNTFTSPTNFARHDSEEKTKFDLFVALRKPEIIFMKFKIRCILFSFLNLITVFPLRVNQNEIERYTQIYQNSLSQPLNAATEDQLENLLQYLFLLHKNVRRPCKIYSGCQEVVKQIMAYRANHYSLDDLII